MYTYLALWAYKQRGQQQDVKSINVLLDTLFALSTARCKENQQCMYVLKHYLHYSSIFVNL